MPQLTNIVLKDGASTPVNHTYNPNGISGTVATLVERAASGVPLGLPTLTLSSTTTSQGRSKVKAVLARPIVQTQSVNGVSKGIVVRTAYATVELSFDASSELQERKDQAALVKSLFDDASFTDMVNNLSTLY